MSDGYASDLGLHVEIDRRINFAMQQNDVPVVKIVHVHNNSDTSVRDLRLRITPEPNFADPWEARIDLIARKSTYNLRGIDLALSPRYLGELTERVRGQLRFTLWCDGDCLVEDVEPVELLARDDWGGLASLPEILAAFVMPNHPALEPILRGAADVLAAWTSDPSMSGYQSKDPRRVYTMAAAIYTALQQLGITYVNPPASFEAEGQRIRLPDRLIESRMGTCLDLAVLAAGCMEQIGLHPFVVVVRNHAFAGAWLQEDCFGEPAIDEPIRFRKRVDLDEIMVFDPTCITNRPLLDFDHAVRAAKKLLESPEDFACAVDVLRARKGRIRPLPEQVQRPGPAPGDAKDGAPQIPASPALDVLNLGTLTRPRSSPPEATETPATRLDRWRRRLLDLSLRNRLLNFRETHKTIPLLCPDVSALEDALAEGTTFQILPRPRELAEDGPRDAEAHRRRTGEEPIAALLVEQLRAKRLHADLGPEDLDRRLLEVYRAARLGVEEGGASALYLAIGFLTWYETPQSSQPHLAPILLFPLELHRRSAGEGFTLRLGDGEPRLNVTLLELLREDYGMTVTGLDPLPEDELGLDVTKILRTFRETVRDIDRWDILKITRIGTFSFAKFLMWRDLAERAGELTKSPVVDHLVNRPKEAFDPGGTFPNADRLDKERSPLQAFCPLPADASQLAAVFAAAEGRSFVLEGPPGTGKSQTITNLIAHCLAEGKTVLFVSEKMAALSVVHDRLQKVGLGRYCLELHSNKAHRRQVVAQLGEALRYYEDRSPKEWEREAQRLEGLRNGLNAYVEALHKRQNTEDTVFQAVSQLIGLRDVTCLDLHWPSPETLDAEALLRLRDIVERLATVATALGDITNHPWETVQRADWTPAWEQEVVSAIERLRQSVQELEERAREISVRLSLGEGGWGQDELALLDELAGLLLDAPTPPTTILVRPDWDAIARQIQTWIEHGRRRDALRAELFECFTEKILDLDLEALELRLNEAKESWWPLSWWRERSVWRELKAVAKPGKEPAPGSSSWAASAATAPPPEGLASPLKKARALRHEEQALLAAGDEARQLFGRYWQDGEPKWEELGRVRDWAQDCRLLATRAAGADFERAAALLEHWARLTTEGRELLRRDGVIGRQLLAYRSAYAGYYEMRHAVDRLLGIDAKRAWGKPADVDMLGTARRRLRGWSERRAQLRDWCAWRRARSEAVGANLAPLVEACERGEFQSRDLRRVFERSYYQWWYTAVVSAEPVLAEFFSPEHERKIQQFREVDARYTELTRQLIVARLADKVPASSAADLPNSEVGVLKREIAKQRRYMSVRKLFGTIPNLLPRLKPCILMSPISVAQYLEPGYPPFDLIVFDEASQIPVWDAVGAMARGAQAVVVGDPKQLPPTSFFQRGEDPDEEVSETETVEDLESILDDCLSARLPCLSLNWHYRSRHESLIAFSNHRYYQNRLLTFPSPYREGIGVSWRHIPTGVYDRGKSATNRAEADAIVAEILHRLRDAERRRWSIGVVTFSQAQQTLIEDLLEEIRRANPEVDTFFSEEAAEPVFIKNLENVQGDERDVILFSICYGPDAFGRVALNFGPMNRDGGERRLNVAITRARREILVFSALRADQIDLARTRARGVHDLKHFLEYAERGASAIAEATHYDPEADFESPFEKAVFESLVGRGWEVHPQVGCARYRIDLAVVDPEAPGRYLLGIECDGANYHRAKTARDRDKLRDGILRDLGWKLHRIWSTDWWTSPEREIHKLEETLERVVKERREQSTRPQSLAIPGEDIAPIVTVSVPGEPPQCPEDPPTGPPEPNYLVYTPYSVHRTLGTQEAFYQASSNRQIREVIGQVVEYEGPISLRLAARRVAAHWGFKQVREQARERVRSLLPHEAVQAQVSGTDVFLWQAGTDPDTHQGFRVSGVGRESTRDADDISIEEVANAILFILRQHISAPEMELARESGRLFGFQRPGERVEARMRAGIERIVRKGAARRDGTTITLEET